MNETKNYDRPSLKSRKTDCNLINSDLFKWTFLSLLALKVPRIKEKVPNLASLVSFLKLHIIHVAMSDIIILGTSEEDSEVCDKVRKNKSVL